MSVVRADFNVRVLEIRSFIELLKEQDKRVSSRSPQINGYKAMKAATHLLIYNLVESTATGIHEQIFDNVRSSGASFDDLIDPLRKTILRNAQRPNVDALLPKLKVLSIDVIEATFDRENLFSGNVDGKKLRASFASLGLNEPVAKGQKAKRGSDSLLVIKGNRNDLAHGRKTFSEVGRDMTPKELEDEFENVCSYLLQCITIVEDYLKSSAYRVS